MIAALSEAGKVQVLVGLAEGETVVVSGQFLLDSESNIDAALSRLGGDPEGMPAEPAGTTDRDNAEHARHSMEPRQ